MSINNKFSSAILGAFLLLAMAVLGLTLKQAIVEYKLLDRSVTVKGLAENEYPADIVIWPIQFTAASNDLEALYQQLDKQSLQVVEFLTQNKLSSEEISLSTPTITDKLAQQYGGNEQSRFRYSALQTVTVYSTNITLVRTMMPRLSELGKTGIAFSQADYDAQVEYIFSRLNEVKPQMIEASTTSARVIAEKFANDSKSQLGKIKKAAQGQFSISNRDKNNPHIKRVRVVSTIEYYLAD
ncbi:SIMPL domain-containing protein [Shewanella sp. SR44-3]|uniref:SIMPL domain-containing protein n=1 Tax=unclassified Shewanella TaxID=196818 RepID=UPI0015FE5351|nr:SIMPL domain-containing protein [Shewanella sp. SR44-3]MBB1270377.1 SIMPL domain-containing protein [Shewanella sp. SR44-3]